MPTNWFVNCYADYCPLYCAVREVLGPKAISLWDYLKEYYE